MEGDVVTSNAMVDALGRLCQRVEAAIRHMAVTLTDIDDREDFAALRQAFLTGYTRIQPLPPGYETSIKPLSATRILFMLQWLLGRSHPEPWKWGEMYLQNAVGRLERLLTEATLP